MGRFKQIGIALSLLALALGWWLSGQILDSLSQAMESVVKLSQGKFVVNRNTSTDDELALLNRQLNDVMQNLSKTFGSSSVNWNDVQLRIHRLSSMVENSPINILYADTDGIFNI